MVFCIDFEATQFSERIISIGAISATGQTFETLVKPVHGDKCNKFITELTGITNEMLAAAPSADEAFNLFFDWVLSFGDEVPTYYCYGSSDRTFLDKTIKYMTNIRAVTFALALRHSLIDYAPIVSKYFHSNTVGLIRVYNLIQKKEEVQTHNALRDATMLKYVQDNLYSVPRCSILPPSPAASHKIGAPAIFLSWDGITLWNANTNASEENYKVKCVAGEKVKYFDSIETAALWVIRFLCKGKSPKKSDDIAAVIKNIRSKKNAYSLEWEEV